MTLRTKLSLVILVNIFATLVIAGFLVFRESRDVIRNLAEEVLKARTQYAYAQCLDYYNNNQGGQLIGVGDFSWDIPNELTVTQLGDERDDANDVPTQFGSVDWNEDGTFTYTPDLNNPAVAALKDGRVLHQLVIALAHTQHDNPQVFAEVVSGRSVRAAA